MADFPHASPLRPTGEIRQVENTTMEGLGNSVGGATQEEER